MICPLYRREFVATEQVGELDVGPATVVLNWKAAPGKKLFGTGTVLVTALWFAHHTNLCAVKSLLPSEVPCFAVLRGRGSR